MANVRKNVLTRGLSGKVGNLVVFRQNGDKTIMGSAPGKRTKPLSDAQLNLIGQFKEAVIYAKSVLANPDKKADYAAAAVKGESAYNLAVADFLKPPVIKEIDSSLYTGQIGSKIRVRVTDNFKLTGCSVTILKADNSVLETGAATIGTNGLDWFYTATHVNSTLTGCKLIAVATDTPGHSTEMSQML